MLFNLSVVILFTTNIDSLPEGKPTSNVRTTRKTNSQYPPKNPFNIDKYKIKDRINDPPAGAYETIDLTSDEEVDIKESIDIVKKYQLKTNTDATTKAARRAFHEKYGTIQPLNTQTHDKPKFKDFMEKYAPSTVSDQIDKERIVTGKNMTWHKEMLSLVKGVDNTDELLSLKVENGEAKLPLRSNRKFMPGTHNLDGNMFKLNYMHINQYIIELMKQAIYQARNRMIFMQDLRKRHRRSGLYKMGFLFAKADQAGKVFASISQKSFRMCSMIRQGFWGVYRPQHDILDIAYALERMETKWFEVDLLTDILVENDNLVRYRIFTNRTLKTPRDLTKAFDALFIE